MHKVRDNDIITSNLVHIIVVHVRAAEIYVAAVEALRKRKDGSKPYESQFGTTSGAFLNLTLGWRLLYFFGGPSDPAPMIALVPFVMNSSSSPLLDLLQALRLGHSLFFFFPHLLTGYP